MIRPATVSDASAIAALWNPVIRDTVATFNATEKSIGDIESLLRQRSQANEPFLLAFDGDILRGFGTYGQFRGGIGYARTVEHTVIVCPKSHGQGTGRALMVALEQDAKSKNHHSMIAGVSGENLPGLRFHAAIGYAEIATLPQVGYKFGRWFDLVLLQKFL